MTNVDNILKDALKLGACSKSSEATDWKSLVWLFFSAQGREFCSSNDYPSLVMFQEMKQGVKPYGVFIDSGSVEVINSSAASIGDTQLIVTINDNTKVYKVIVMHGGKIEINASNYAVILIVDNGGEVIINKDETVKIL